MFDPVVYCFCHITPGHSSDRLMTQETPNIPAASIKKCCKKALT